MNKCLKTAIRGISFNCRSGIPYGAGLCNNNKPWLLKVPYRTRTSKNNIPGILSVPYRTRYRNNSPWLLEVPYVTMSSKVQPREHTAPPTTKIESRVGPETKFFVNAKGKQIHCSYWRPNDCTRIRGLVYLCHGFAEHLQWYEDLALRLTAGDLLAFGHDHVGHGRSEGVKGHVENVDDYVEDVLRHCDDVRAGHPGLPLFLVGHSMGGMIAIRTAMARPELFRGVVLMGPLIRANESEATPLKIFLARLVARLLPYITVATLKLEHVTRDQDMRNRLKKDPLRYHGGIRARWAAACVESLLRIEEQMDSVEWSFLVLHGEADQLCSLDGSRDFLKRAASTDKELKVFPAASHNLYLEVPDVRLQALQDTVEWITARLPDPSTK